MIAPGYADDRRASARLLAVVAALYLLFAFYGSWVPLHFVRLPLGEAIREFAALPFLDQRIESATDWATNFLLLIPLSFLWAQRFVGDQRGLAAASTRLALVALGVAVAFALEFSQLYFPPRTVSQKDILALSLGVFASSVAQYRWGAVVEHWLNMLWQRESQKARVLRLLHVYLLVLFVFNMLPLDLTLSVVEIYHKWREGRVLLMPFSGLKGELFTDLYKVTTDTLVWIPVGLFLALERRSSVLKIALVGGLLSTAIEVAQLLVYSTISDTTDILLAVFGSVIGGLLIGKGHGLLESSANARSGFWCALWLLWVFFVLGVSWFPYDFDPSLVSAEAAWAALTRTPFLLLYQNTALQAVSELLRKIGFFLPVGILWALSFSDVPDKVAGFGRSFGRHFGGALIALMLPLLVEGGQLLLPNRYADLTDALLEATFCLLGLLLVHWVRKGHPHSASGATAPEPSIQATHTPPAKPITRTPPPVSRISHLTTFIVLTLAVGVVTRLPMIPYNIRELNAPGLLGLLTTLGLALAIYWLANGHFLFLAWAGQARLLWLPVWLAIHGLVVWIILRLTVPMESIEDIVGSSVLAWPWEWELMGRYLALHAGITLPAIGAILFVLSACRRAPVARFVFWGLCAILLFWPLHLVIIDYAATDNLTELMRDGGSALTSLLLASGLLALFTAAASIAAVFAFPEQRLRSLLLAGIASLVTGAAFWYGSEHLIMKYGKVFSAWQFLLSSDRQHYAATNSLLLRYLVAYAATVCLLGTLQISHLRNFARSYAHNYAQNRGLQ